MARDRDRRRWCDKSLSVRNGAQRRIRRSDAAQQGLNTDIADQCGLAPSPGSEAMAIEAILEAVKRAGWVNIVSHRSAESEKLINAGVVVGQLRAARDSSPPAPQT